MNTVNKKNLIKLVSVAVISATVLTAFSIPLGALPVIGDLLFPGSDVWQFPNDVVVDQTLRVDGMDDEVIVYRDEWGVPHIYSTTEADAMFALGYVQAQDRLFMMEMARRLTRGKLAEVMGPGALETDKYNLNMLKEYWTIKTVENIRLQAQSDTDIAEMLSQLEKFRDGVNHYIDTTNVLPVEYSLLGFTPTHWTLEDSLSMQKYMAEDLTWGYSDLVSHIYSEMMGHENYTYFSQHPRPYQIPIVPDFGNFPDTPHYAAAETNAPSELTQMFNEFLESISEFPQEQQRQQLAEIIGSNNWVVNGSKTESGKPILANDMHLGWNLPGIWYQGHVIVEDPESPMNLWGFFLPGVPYPLVGQNQHVAWGFTNTAYDVLDWYYYESINETHYNYLGDPVAYEYIDYSIRVWGQDNEAFSVKTTEEGRPFFTNFIGDSYTPEEYVGFELACQWIGHYASEEFNAFYGYAHATNRTEFNEASSHFWAPAQNHVYADDSGHIAIRPTGRVPIRDDTGIPMQHTGNGSMPYNGSAGQGQWTGWVPFDELPHSENPSQGYLVSANQIIAGPDYLENYTLQSGYAEGFRARRINELLATQDDITVEDIVDIQLDVYEVLAASIIPEMVAVVDPISSKSTTEVNALNLLRDWDYMMFTNSSAATIYKSWIECYREAIIADDLRVWNLEGREYLLRYAYIENLTHNQQDSHWFDDISTPAIEDRNATILTAFRKAISGLEDYFENDDVSTWKWGEIHFVEFNHLTGLGAFSAGPFPAPGTGYTVNPSYGDLWSSGEITPIVAHGGASERVIIDFNDFSKSISVIPSGQRGVPTSKHYTDQLEMFLNGEYHPNYFHATTASAFNQVWVESTLTIKPRRA